MRSFLEKIFLFVLITAMLFTLAEILFARYNGEPRHYALQYREIYDHTQQSINGIILGSSHSTHALRPSLLDSAGIRFYNYSFVAAGPRFYSRWFKDVYLKHNEYPEYVIYAVDYFMFDRNRLTRQPEDDAEYLSSQDYFSMFFSAGNTNREKMILSRSVIFRGGKKFLLPEFNELNSKIYPVQEYDRGFIPYDLPPNSAIWQPLPLSAIKDDDQLKDDFENLIKDLKAHKAKIWFVSTPEYVADTSIYKKAGAFQFVDAIAGKYSIPFYNFNTGLRSSFNDSIKNFCDWEHLSREGSTIFSRRFAGLLQ